MLVHRKVYPSTASNYPGVEWLSLETGRKLGLISSILLVILPAAGIAVFAGFLAVILSAVQLGTGAVPTIPGLVGASVGLGLSIVAIAVLGLVAVVLFVVAMYYLSHYYNDRVIFTNVIYAIILMVATGIVVWVVEFLYLLPIVTTITPSTTSPSTFFGSGFFVGIIALAVVSIVITIISGVLVWRALNRLGEKSEVDNFKTAGLLYLIGVLLSIIVIGVIIVWVAFILAAVGFYRLKPIQTYVPETPAVPPVATQTKRCPNCGTENTLDAANCRFCGKPLQ